MKNAPVGELAMHKRCRQEQRRVQKEIDLLLELTFPNKKPKVKFNARGK